MSLWNSVSLLWRLEYDGRRTGCTAWLSVNVALGFGARWVNGLLDEEFNPKVDVVSVGGKGADVN